MVENENFAKNKTYNNLKDELSSHNLTIKTPINYVEKISKDCKQCGHCCSYDSGIFLKDDIDRISEKLGVPKEDFIERYLVEKEIFNKKVHKAKLKKDGKPFGKCIFLEEKECSIHDIKPLHCRIGSGCHELGTEISIWFMLNHIVDKNDPEAIRQWSQYLKTHPTIPGGELNELVPKKDELNKILRYDKLKP